MLISIIKKLTKQYEVSYIAIVFFLYLLLLFLISQIEGIRVYEILEYPMYMNFTIIPAYLYYLLQHNSYVSGVYCKIRFSSKNCIFTTRVVMLVVEGLQFCLAFTVVLLAITASAKKSIIIMLLSSVNLLVGLLQLGIIYCTICLLIEKDYIPLICICILLTFDCYATAGFFANDIIPIFYVPLLSVFSAAHPIDIIINIASMLIKLSVLSILSYLLFRAKEIGFKNGD